MQDGVLLFDGGWRTVFANRALERHLGARPEALAQVYPPSLRETIRRVAESGLVEVAEIETGTPTRWLRVTATPAGTDGSVLVVVADITEARRLDAVRRDFVANASHELKTPAASIQAAAETLLHVWQEDPAAVPRFAQQLEREAVRLSRIVADLLDLSRLESGSELQERVHLDALVREETSRFEEAATEAGSDAGRRRPSSRRSRVRARPVAAGPEPVGQRDPLHEGRRNDHRVGGGRQRVGRPARERHRLRDPVEGSDPGVRALLPGGPRPLARDGRHRTGTRHRAPRRREPRRHRDGDERAGKRLDVRGSAADGSQPTRTGRAGP